MIRTDRNNLIMFDLRQHVQCGREENSHPSHSSRRRSPLSTRGVHVVLARVCYAWHNEPCSGFTCIHAYHARLKRR